MMEMDEMMGHLCLTLLISSDSFSETPPLYSQ